MNRRSFLKLVGAGLPSVVVAEKLGLIERERSYFFAPRGGWPQGPALTREMLRAAFEQIRNNGLLPPYSFAKVDRFVYMNNEGIWELNSHGSVLLSTKKLVRIPHESLRLLYYNSREHGSWWRIRPESDFRKAILISAEFHRCDNFLRAEDLDLG